MIRALHVPVREIDFQLFGAGIRLKGSAPGYGREALICLAGPAANFAAAGLCLLAGSIFPNNALLQNAAAMNLLLGAFNLLPAAPLDGGRALEALLCTRLSPQAAGTVMTALSAAVLLPVAAAGFFLLLHTHYNFTLFIAAAYLAAALVCRGRLIGNR